LVAAPLLPPAAFAPALLPLAVAIGTASVRVRPFTRRRRGVLLGCRSVAGRGRRCCAGIHPGGLAGNAVTPRAAVAPHGRGFAPAQRTLAAPGLAAAWPPVWPPLAASLIRPSRAPDLDQLFRGRNDVFRSG